MPEPRIWDEAKAFIFDCDGTLADTASLHAAAWVLALQEYGHVISDADLVRQVGRPNRDFIEVLIAENSWTDIDPDEFAARKNRITRALLLQGEVAAIEPVVAVARRRGQHVLMAVLSSGVRENVDLTLAAIGLPRDAFAQIVTIDDDAPHKPSPDAFLYVAEKLGVNPRDCVVFEDADEALDGARQAGMLAIDARTMQSWGFKT